MAQAERYVVGLDIGTSKVCTVVGEIVGKDELDVIGIGSAESKDWQGGVSLRPPSVDQEIAREAELMAGVDRLESISASAARTSRASTAAASPWPA